MTALLSSQDFLSFHALPGSPRPVPMLMSSMSTPSSPALHAQSAAPAQDSSSSTPSDASDSKRPRLMLSPEQRADFVAHIEESKKNFASDTAHLPKTTNMGMSDADAAAAQSQNRYNYKAQWDDDDADVATERRRQAAALAKSATVFQMAIPCIYVSNMANSVAFYQKMFGFTTLGKPAAHQTVLRRGPPHKPKVVNGRLMNAVPLVSEDPGVRIILRMRPEEWGELSGDGLGPPQMLMAVNSADDMFKEIAAKEYALRPKGDEYFPEVAFHKARVLSKPQNKPWGTRELHVLDPDGNKIVFYHELNL